MNYKNYRPFLQHSLAQSVVSETICKLFDGQLCNLFMNFLLGPDFDQLDKVNLSFGFFFTLNLATKWVYPWNDNSLRFFSAV